jgi:predicted nucleotidyltransferase
MPHMGMRRSTESGDRLVRVRAQMARTTSLADALFTATQQRVLRLIYGQPERSFFANELIAMTRSGSGAVQRELARLVESGLVTSRTIGRQRHYQANSAAPIFEELRRIVLKTFGAAYPLKDALRPLERQIASAAIYGSVAKGNDRAASDIDLLIVSDDLMLEELYRVLDPVEQSLGRKINPTLIKSKELDARRKDSFLSKVLAGPVIPLIGESLSLGRVGHEATR